jgi:hypothetical protein
MSKRLFQILDEMNVADGENKTDNVAISNSVVSANKAKGGAHVVMGMPEKYLYDLMQDGKKIALLLVIDKAEYDKAKESATPSTDTAGLEAELKELDHSFDYLCKMDGVKDAGHRWIAFSDKWQAFKKSLIKQYKQ